VKDWFVRVMETAIPGSSQTTQRFDLRLCELTADIETDVGGIKVTPYLVNHGQPEGPFFSLRLKVENRVITYTGDTEWTEALVPAARKADLFIAEAYFREKSVPLHLDLATLETHLPAIGAKRVILTHMSDDMLAQRGDVDFETAEDGLIVEI
jgi:ribonuclease BN (tRNA processing enzyme)